MRKLALSKDESLRCLQKECLSSEMRAEDAAHALAQQKDLAKFVREHRRIIALSRELGSHKVYL